MKAEQRPADVFNHTPFFWRDVLKLVSGSAIGQALSIAAAPILTRLYAPEAFGVLGLFLSIVSILSIVSCMRYELSIMLPDQDEEAANLLAVSIGFVFLFSVLTSLAVVFGKTTLASWLNTPELAAYLWLLPPAILFNGILLALNYWNSRLKKLGRMSFLRVTTSLTTTAGQLGAGYGGHATGEAMIGASVAGPAVAALWVGGFVWRDNSALFRRIIDLRKMLKALKRHRKFPIFGTWSILLGVMSWQLPVFILSIYFSPAIVGFYLLGFRVLQMPMSLVGNAISQIFYQRAASARDNETLAPLVENLFKLLVQYGLFPMLMLTVIGADLFEFIFGSQWIKAGVYIQLLSIYTFMVFVSGPFTTIFATLEKQELQLKWSVVNFFSRLATLLVGGFLHSAEMALLLFGIMGFIMYGYKVYLTLQLSGVSILKSVFILIRYLCLFFPAGVILTALIFFDVAMVWRLLIAGTLLGIYYLAIFSLQNKDKRVVVQ